MPFERYVDTTLAYLLKRLDDSYVKPNLTCDLSKWLQFFAFDVMGELTFSTRFGFLERGNDVDNIIASIWHYFVNTSPVS